MTYGGTIHPNTLDKIINAAREGSIPKELWGEVWRANNNLRDEESLRAIFLNLDPRIEEQVLEVIIQPLKSQKSKKWHHKKIPRTQ